MPRILKHMGQVNICGFRVVQKSLKVEPEWFDFLEGKNVYLNYRNICTYPPAHQISQKIAFLEGYVKHHETIFQVDFLDVILILTQSLQYSIQMHLGVGRCDHPFSIQKIDVGGDQLKYIKGGYLTILEPPPFLFTSRVCLRRQFFCANDYLDKNYIFPWFEPVCSHFAFLHGLPCWYSKISVFNSNRPYSLKNPNHST